MVVAAAVVVVEVAQVVLEALEVLVLMVMLELPETQAPGLLLAVQGTPELLEMLLLYPAQILLE